ncbi:MAG: helix-turn-helix domain-containing protein [Candidatus Binatia bacterium]
MSMDDAELRLLALREAAAILQISKRTLLRMIQGGEVRAFKVGGQWRMRESHLRQWVELKENSMSPLPLRSKETGQSRS